jgi:hypothetical protein
MVQQYSKFFSELKSTTDTGVLTLEKVMKAQR